MSKDKSAVAGLYLWEVEATGHRGVLLVTTATHSAEKATKKVAALLRRAGHKKPKVDRVEYIGTLDA